MSFAGYFLPVLFCMLSMLISDSRFDLVWFRLSCDHGWIRSGSVNVRKQQQQHKKKPNKWRTIKSLVQHTKFDFSVEEGKERLNPSREKKTGNHRRRKVDEKSCVTFLLCDPG